MTDEERDGNQLEKLKRVPRGTGVIFRHYNASDRPALAKSVARICRRRGLVLSVAGDARLAWKVGAAGLHLPEGMIRRGLRSRFAWWRGILTVSAHSLSALKTADTVKAHAVLLSPVFPTASHPEASPLGPVGFARLRRHVSSPLYALGGLNIRTLRRLKGSGAAGIATVSGLSLFSKRGHPLFLPQRTKGKRAA